MPLADRLAALPSVFEALDALRDTYISQTTGFWLERQGRGHSQVVCDHVHPRRSSSSSREHLLAKPFVDHGFLRRLWGDISALLRYIPTERHLVHGDYGHNNLLIEGGRVTAGRAGAIQGDVRLTLRLDLHELTGA